MDALPLGQRGGHIYTKNKQFAKWYTKNKQSAKWNTKNKQLARWYTTVNKQHSAQRRCGCDLKVCSCDPVQDFLDVGADCLLKVEQGFAAMDKLAQQGDPGEDQDNWRW